MGCYDWWLRVVSWPSGGAHRAPEAVASPRWWPFRSRFALKKRARKRGNLSMADTLRTNIQQRTQHARWTEQWVRQTRDMPRSSLAKGVGGRRAAACS